MSEDTEQPGPESVPGTPDASLSPGGWEPPGTAATPAEPPAQDSPAWAPPAAPSCSSQRPQRAPGPRPRRASANGEAGRGGGPSNPPPQPAWGQPGGEDPGPVTPVSPVAPVAPAAIPFTYPPAGDQIYPGAAPGANGKGRTTPGRVRAWLPVALVAAVIGGVIGAGVTAIADHNNNGNGTPSVIHEGSATPGAAVLSGNVTIPQLVDRVIPAVVSIDVKAGGSEDQGTGMIITSNGEVVTNNHVIELYVENGNSGAITVTEYGQTKPLPTTLVGYDQTKDVALLKINNAIQPSDGHLR